MSAAGRVAPAGALLHGGISVGCAVPSKVDQDFMRDRVSWNGRTNSVIRTHRVVVREQSELPHFLLESSADVRSEGIADVLNCAFLLRGWTQLVRVRGYSRASEDVGALPQVLELVLCFRFERRDGLFDLFLQASLLGLGLLQSIPAPECVVVVEVALLGVELVRVRGFAASDDQLKRAAGGGLTADALGLGFAVFFSRRDGAGNEAVVHCDRARSPVSRQQARVAKVTGSRRTRMFERRKPEKFSLRPLGPKGTGFELLRGRACHDLKPNWAE